MTNGSLLSVVSDSKRQNMSVFKPSHFRFSDPQFGFHVALVIMEISRPSSRNSRSLL